MDINILHAADIQILKISNEISLFFHSPSLQIYPLKDIDLILFLSRIKSEGYENTKKLYDEVSFNDMHSFIIEKIKSAPPTTAYEIDDVQKNNYKTVVLPISSNCNLNCPYCFAQTHEKFNFNSFETDDIENIIKFLVENKVDKESYTNLVFFGGEPLLNFPIIKHTINYIKNNHPDFLAAYSITTNGTIINDEILEVFKNNDFMVLLSIDGYDNEYNLRNFKNGSKSIDKILNNIDLLKQNNIKLHLRATFVSNNPYLIETYKFFENLQVPFNIVFAYNSENKSHKELCDYDSNTINNIDKKLNELLEYYIEKLKNKQIIYMNTLNDFSNAIRYRLIESIICGAGLNYYVITANGDIFSCPHLMNDTKFKIGNINAPDINKENLIPIPINQIKDCEKCWIRNLCLGGCPSQKISVGLSNRNSLSQNECELEKTKWEFILKLYYYAMYYNPEYFTQNEVTE